MEQYQAPIGTVWVCMMCGKRAKNRANGGISRGWDVSCFLNAILCREDSLIFKEGLVIRADAIEEGRKDIEETP